MTASLNPRFGECDWANTKMTIAKNIPPMPSTPRKIPGTRRPLSDFGDSLASREWAEGSSTMEAGAAVSRKGGGGGEEIEPRLAAGGVVVFDVGCVGD